MVTKDILSHFWTLQKKLKSGEPFAFTRFSDGEMFVMMNKHLKLDGDATTVSGAKAGIGYSKEDHKEFDPEKHSDFRNKLVEAYKHQQKNYFVGLSCPCCVGTENNKWMKEERGQDDEYLTWANLLVNAQYPLFLNHMVPLLKGKKVVVICNKAADLNDLPFEVCKDFRIGANAMINDQNLLEDIPEWLKAQEGPFVFLFAAASLSNLLIYSLFKEFPENTYMDIGTTLNPFMKLPIARDYLKGYFLKSGSPDIHKRCVW